MKLSKSAESRFWAQEAQEDEHKDIKKALEKKAGKKSSGKKDPKKKMVISHLKGDIQTFKKEASEDRELIHKLKRDPQPKRRAKVERVMEEFKERKLHSSSKKGPKVTSRKQAISIALSEARKAGEKVSPLKKKKRAIRRHYASII